MIKDIRFTFSSLLLPWNGKGNVASNLHFLLVIAVACSLLVNVQLCSLFTILLFVNWVVAGEYEGLTAKANASKEGFLLIVFFLLHVVGLFYSSNLKYGFSDVERKLSLLLIPLVVLTKPLSIRKRDCTIAIFTLFAIFLSLVGVARGYFNYEAIANTRGPEHLVTHFVDMHRVYFSMYLLFCFLSVFYLRKAYQLDKHSVWNWISILCAALLTAFIFIMASRMVIILLVLSCTIMIFYFTIVKKREYIKAAFLLGLGMLVMCIIYSQVGYVRSFMTQLTEKLDQGQTEDMNSVNVRVVKYKCAIQGIEKNWLTGVGTGDIQDTLNHLYLENDFHLGYQVNMDAHNQYLQTWLAQGLPGLILLLSFIIINLRKGILERNYLLVFVLVIFAICSLSESLLTTQKGIVYLSLFFPLTYFSHEFFKGKNEA